MEKIPRSQAFQKLLSRPNLAKVTLFNTQRDLPISLPQMRKAVSFLLNELKISTQEIVFHLVTEKQIGRIHKDFFNDPSPTDCITFPIDAVEEESTPHHLLGEAFICPKTALNYAKQHRLNPNTELYRYVIHCILHLIGYDDAQADERAKMKRKERACLKKLSDKGYVSPLRQSARSLK